jgi:hypothetical protein
MFADFISGCLGRSAAFLTQQENYDISMAMGMVAGDEGVTRLDAVRKSLT